MRLVRHFIQRLSDSDDPSGERRISSGALLGILAAPGAFLALLLLDKYSSLLNFIRGRPYQDLYVVSAADKFLFISVAMAVTGIVTVLKWDRVVPDEQDYLNLAPLPVRPRAILLANATAIALAVLIFAIDTSALSSVLFPFVICAAMDYVTLGGFAQFIAVHAVCLMLASVFTFCAVFALLGSISALMPRSAFRAISPWLRGAVLIAFLVLSLSGFAGSSILRQFAAQPELPLRWLPSLWFLGLYQTLQHRPTPAFLDMARIAWHGTGVAFSIMVVAYAAGYRRRFGAVLEGRPRRGRQRGKPALVRVLDLFAPRADGFARASYRFVVRALLQNEEHRLCLAVALGLGWLLALQSVAGARAEHGALPAVGVLEAPLKAAYLLILGLRVALEMPVAVKANWVFQIVVDPKENETAAIARRVMHAYLALFVMAPCLAGSLWRLEPVTALLHTLYALALAAFLVELLLKDYRKMPLGCPAPGFHNNLLALCMAQIFYFVAFTGIGGAAEHWMLQNPRRFVSVPILFGALWICRRWKVREELRDGEREPGMAFENPLDPAMERLKLFEG